MLLGIKIGVRDSSFLKVESLRCSGRGLTVPPPACVKTLRALSNQPQSQCQASPAWKWVMRMFTPHSTYPPWALMGLPCYFCTPSPYWTAVKDCVGCWRHMAFPSICRQHAEPVAKQVDSNNPLHHHHQVSCPLHPSRPRLGNGNDSPLPQRLPDHFQVTPTGLAHPSPAVSQNNNMPKCCRHSKQKALSFLTTYWRALFFKRKPHSEKKGRWTAALKIAL